MLTEHIGLTDFSIVNRAHQSDRPRACFVFFFNFLTSLKNICEAHSE